MNNMFYLLNIRVSGIKSIKDEVRVDFYKKTLNKDFKPDNYRVKAIYGENGSGKSALITAIKIFQELMLDNRYLNESKTQSFLNEIVNKITQKFCFSCEYLIELEEDRLIYFYTIELGRGTDGQYEIKKEILKVKNGNYTNGNYKTIYESGAGELISVRCAEEHRTEMEKNMMNLLSASSFPALYIMKLKKYPDKEDELFLHVMSQFVFSLLLKVYLDEEDQHELYFLRKKLKQNQHENEKLAEGLEGIVNSIEDFAGVNEKKIQKAYFEKYQEKIKQLTKFIQLFKKDLISIDIDAKENGDVYDCELNLNYGAYIVNKEFESTGIKKLIRLYDCLTAADNGGIVFVDEMDSNINDVYLCAIIEYFMYYGKGQLCFTMHNLDPMTILKENKNSIDFLSSDNKLVSWAAHGNASPQNCYKNGMIEYSPFNIDASDFVGMFGE